MNNKMQKGFTLAELMIVLAVLGIIAAILTPILFDSMPDENRLKFKKGFYTLNRTMDSVINSEFYEEGDLSKGANANTFCNVFADTLNTTFSNCVNGKAPNPITYTYSSTDTGAALDTACGATPANSSGTSDIPTFITQDNIWWWGFHYDYRSPAQHAGTGNDSGVNVVYGIVCFDVDGPGGESPFGFGVRNDGKVVVGARAKSWLNQNANNVLQTEN